MAKLVKVRHHLMSFLNYQFKHKLKFKTHDIQDLSLRGKEVFGKRLGSTETYTRCFRKLKRNGTYNVDKLKSPNSNEATWFVRSKND